MNAYLSRLGIRPEVQEWVEAWCHTDEIFALPMATTLKSMDWPITVYP